MAKLEKTIKHEIIRKFGAAPDLQLFKNEQLQAMLPDGQGGFRPYRSGLGVGTSDLVGWKETIITPAMVGMTFARFLAAELKKPVTGKKTPEQIAFINHVIACGGIGFFATSIEEFENKLRMF